MSWIDKIQTDLVITTGDRKEYKPNWLKATKAKEFHVSEFDFPEKDGTLVRRGRPRGRRYDLELYFQGENHLDVSEAFDISSDDPRPWTIAHPFYGTLTVQPNGLMFDNTAYNVTKITGSVMETIVDENPKTSVNAVDKIISDKSVLNETFGVSFNNRVDMDVDVMNRLSANNALLFHDAKRKIKLTVDAEEYFNLFTKANSSVLNATAEPLAAINQVQAMINAPFLFEDSVKNRVAILSSQFEVLNNSVSTLTTPAGKVIYENNAGMLLSSMAVASATPINKSDYRSRNEVYSIIEIILNANEQFLSNLDSLQTENGADEESYIPNYDSINSLNELINFTISNLFTIAINSKQERAILVEDDTNVVTLAHRFYGLAADDSTIDDLIRHNNIGLSELLLIRKGRKIVYYK